MSLGSEVLLGEEEWWDKEMKGDEGDKILGFCNSSSEW